MKTTTLTAEGMTCGGCVNAVKKALASVPGVSSVDVELSTKKVTISHGDSVTQREVEQAVRKAGFRPA